MIRHIEKHNHLPDYEIEYDDVSENVYFKNRNTMPLEKDKTWSGTLSTNIMERVGKLNLDTDKYALEQGV